MHKDLDARRAYQRAYHKKRRAEQKLVGLCTTTKIQGPPAKLSDAVSEFNEVSIEDLTQEKFDGFVLALGWDMARGKMPKIEAETRKAGLELMRAMIKMLPSEKVAETKSGKHHARYMSDKKYRDLVVALDERQQELDALL